MITWLCCIGQGAENAAGNAGDALRGRKSPEWALVCLLVVIILNTKKTPQENPAAFCVESKLRVSEGSTQGDGRFHRL